MPTRTLGAALRLALLSVGSSALLFSLGCSGGASAGDDVAESRVTTQASFALCRVPPLPSADHHFALLERCDANGTHRLERLEIDTGMTTVVASFTPEQQITSVRGTDGRFAYSFCGGLPSGTACEVHVRNWSLDAADHVVSVSLPMASSQVSLEGIELVGDRLAVFVSRFGQSSLILSEIGSDAPPVETFLGFSPTQEFVMFFQSLGLSGFSGRFRVVSMLAPDKHTLLVRGSAVGPNAPFDNQVWKLDLAASKLVPVKLTESLPQVQESLGFDGTTWTFKREDTNHLAKLDATTGAITDLGSARDGYAMDVTAPDAPVWFTRQIASTSGGSPTWKTVRLAADGTETEIYSSSVETGFSVSDDKKWIYLRPTLTYPTPSDLVVVPAAGGAARTIATDVVGVDDARDGKILVEHHDAIDVIELATGNVISTTPVPFNWAVYRLDANAQRVFAQHRSDTGAAELYVLENGASAPALVRSDDDTTAAVVPVGARTLYARTTKKLDPASGVKVDGVYVDVLAP